MDTTTELIALLQRCLPMLEREAEPDHGYGYFRPENPHDFSPDAESCTEEEIVAHAAACAAWDAGTYEAPRGSERLSDEDGKKLVHILRAPWGIGSYTVRNPEAEALANDVRAALGLANLPTEG